MSSPDRRLGDRVARLRTTAAAVVPAWWFPLVLLGTIGLVDVAIEALPFSLVITGLLDEVGHVATAGLVLLAVVGSSGLLRFPGVALWMVAGSVLIDADHIPLYAGLPGISVGGRPFSHSLLTVVVLAAVWLLSRRRWWIAGALGVGVLLHLVRDLGNGPGLVLFWPVSDVTVREPTWVYWGLMVVLAGVGMRRARSGRGEAHAAPGVSGHNCFGDGTPVATGAPSPDQVWGATPGTPRSPPGALEREA